MKLNGIYQSAVKLSMSVVILFIGAFALSVALNYPLPTPLAFMAMMALYVMLTPSIILHMPLANGEIIPIPDSVMGWTFGVLFLLFMLFILSLTIVLAWRFLRAKR